MEGHEPLLLGYKRATSTSGPKLSRYLSAGFNLFNALIGSGILVMPSAFAMAGVGASVVTLLLISFISAYSCVLLLRAKHLLPSRDGRYDEVGEEAFGAPGRILAEAAIVISQVGTTASYLLFVAKDMAPMVASFLKGPSRAPESAEHTFHLSPTAAVLLLLFPLSWLLQLIRKIESLSSVSSVNAIALVVGIALIFTDGARRMREEGRELRPPWDVDANGPLFNSESYANFFGVAAFSLCCHALSLPIAESLETPPLASFGFVLRISLLGFPFRIEHQGLCN